MKVTAPREILPIIILLSKIELCKDIKDYIGSLYLNVNYCSLKCDVRGMITFIPVKSVDIKNYHHTSPRFTVNTILSSYFTDNKMIVLY